MQQQDKQQDQFWLGKLTKLNPASARESSGGKAPHKPLLLLCVVDLIESGELSSRAFTRTPSLLLRFRSYGAIVADRWPGRLELKLPFFHLSTQQFWRALNSELKPATSPEDCLLCEIDPDFFALLQSAEFRLKARLLLISKYFTATEQIAFFESLGIQAAAEHGPRVMEEAALAAKRKGRSAQFAIRVVTEYRFTCALTGYRCISISGANIVDAAHIEPWARTQNDDVTNGLALSKSAHWMFDEGLWSADDELRIVINSRRFTENGPEFIKLSSFAGRHLQFDPSAKLRPAREMFKRHRAFFVF